MLSNKSFNIILIVTIIIIFAFGFAMLFLIKESDKCISNPLVYGINKIKAHNQETAYTFCSCTVQDIGQFTFDNKGMYITNPTVRPTINNTNNNIISFISNRTA